LLRPARPCATIMAFGMSKRPAMVQTVIARCKDTGAMVMKGPKTLKGTSGTNSNILNRKTECISKPKMWVRKGHHKRVVFFGKTDKKGRVYTKTPGQLRKQDLMQNKCGRVVSKRMHARGKLMFHLLKPCIDARNQKARALGMTGFIKAKRDGTYEQRQLCLVMRVAAALVKKPAGEAEAIVARIEQEADVAAGGDPASVIKRPSNSTSPSSPDETHFAPDTKVALHGLTTASGEKINGKTGIVLSYGSEQPGRYQIKLDKPIAGLPAADGYTTAVVHIKPENVKELEPKTLLLGGSPLVD